MERWRSEERTGRCNVRTNVVRISFRRGEVEARIIFHEFKRGRRSSNIKKGEANVKSTGTEEVTRYMGWGVRGRS